MRRTRSALLLLACLAQAVHAQAPCDALVARTRAQEAGHPAVPVQAPRELCFSDAVNCASSEFSAERVWRHAADAATVRAELEEYTNWRTMVTQAHSASKRGDVLHLARIVGTAHCVRDTWLLRQANQYRIIHSASLDDLSAEGGNCVDAAVSLEQAGAEPLVVTDFHSVLTAYRFDPAFELRAACSVRYRAGDQAP